MTLKEAINTGIIKVTDIANACGVTKQTVYNWLIGKQHIRLKDALTIRVLSNNLIKLEDMI